MSALKQKPNHKKTQRTIMIHNSVKLYNTSFGSPQDLLRKLRCCFFHSVCLIQNENLHIKIFIFDLRYLNQGAKKGSFTACHLGKL